MRIDRPHESVPLFDHAESPGAASPVVRGPPGGAAAPFLKTLTGLGRALDQGEALTESAARGGPGLSSLSPATLLALQSGIYRYTEVVDLASKLVDRATSAVKATLQNS